MSEPQGTKAGPVDILHGSIAEMTWSEVEAAAERGAVLLWGFGVIEQHGPHLPAGTDIYLPSARLVRVQSALRDRGIEALILPPYYWGINVVSGGFPASYQVRPEVMRELMADVLAGLGADGFRHIFCFSGHGDALHNKTIYAGIMAGSQRTSADISFVIDPALATRIGLKVDDPVLTVVDAGRDLSPSDVQRSSPSITDPGQGAPSIDVHAGRWETSMMMSVRPDLVREDVRTTLVGTDHGPEQLAVWRKGFEAARRTTPLGYFGDPAEATLELGDRSLALSATQAAAAISARLGRA